MRRHFCLIAVCFMTCIQASAQPETPLYPGRIPNNLEVPDTGYYKSTGSDDSLAYEVSIPTLRRFMPSGAREKIPAVIICPGGGYGGLVTKREGSEVARALAARGIAAFVLKYRLPNRKKQADPSEAPLQEALEAIRTVRHKAVRWRIDPSRIGIMGFSAGGHVAATAGTHFDKMPAYLPGEVRPDFLLLVYPVISLSDSTGHRGSRDNLLGPQPAPEKIRAFSNELQVSANTPPAFLVHSGADQVVSVKNSLHFYSALLRQQVPAALHVYSRGRHGFLDYPSFDEWFGRCLEWMKSEGFL